MFASTSIGTSILVDVVREARSTTSADLYARDNDSPHGHTRRRAEGIIIPDIIPRATMRTSHKSYHPQTHVHHVFFGQTPYRPAEPGVPLPRRASPLVRYCGEALPHNHENNPLRHPRSGLLQPRLRPAFLNQAQL